MGRAIYPHELGDADFAWLVNSYREAHPDAMLIEEPSLPLVLFRGRERPEHTDPFDDLIAEAAAKTRAQESEANSEEGEESDLP
jgi:hypothetical protein